MGTPAPAWLYDDKTGQTRWWNGSDWTDHTRPLDPVVRTSTAQRPGAAYVPQTSTGPRARPSRVLLLTSLMGVAGLLLIGLLAFQMATSPGALDVGALLGGIAQ